MDRLRNDRNVKNSDRRTNMRGKHKCRESKIISEIVFEENETEKESNRRERKEKT